MSEIHMIFGTGPLGQSVMQELLRRGKTVRMANRSGNRPDGIPAEVEVIGGDAFNTDFTRQVARGAAVVYQCAQPDYAEWTTKFVPLQNAILEGAAAAGAKLIIGDNLYMYGEVNGPIHEDLPYAAITRKGKARAEAARQVLAAHQTGKVRARHRARLRFLRPWRARLSLWRPHVPARLCRAKPPKAWETWMRLTPIPLSMTLAKVWSSSVSATQPSVRSGTSPMPSRSARVALSS